MALKSNKRDDGRFVQGGVVDDFGNRLGWWERKIFHRSPTDVKMTITPRYHKRPDLLAYDAYGTANLMWFILQYNHISDITTFVPGLEITLPTRTRLFSEMLTKLTANPST